MCAVMIGQTLHAPQDVRHMRPQGSRTQVHIGQYDVAQLLKKRPPPSVIGQDAGVQHLGCGQHDTWHGLLDGAAFCARGIALVSSAGHTPSPSTPSKVVAVVALGYKPCYYARCRMPLHSYSRLRGHWPGAMGGDDQPNSNAAGRTEKADARCSEVPDASYSACLRDAH